MRTEEEYNDLYKQVLVLRTELADLRVELAAIREGHEPAFPVHSASIPSNQRGLSKYEYVCVHAGREVADKLFSKTVPAAKTRKVRFTGESLTSMMAKTVMGAPPGDESEPWLRVDQDGVMRVGPHGPYKRWCEVRKVGEDHYEYEVDAD